MNLVSRIITGAGLILFGACLLILPFFVKEGNGIYFTWIYGLPILIIGFVILLNRKEDDIEQIKSQGGKK